MIFISKADVRKSLLISKGVERRKQKFMQEILPCWWPNAHLIY